ALGRDRFDRAGLDLAEEVRAERNLGPRLPGRLRHQHRDEVDRQQRSEEDPEATPAARWTRLVLVGHAAAVRRRGHPPAALVLRPLRRRNRLVGGGVVAQAGRETRSLERCFWGSRRTWPRSACDV